MRNISYEVLFMQEYFFTRKPHDPLLPLSTYQFLLLFSRPAFYLYFAFVGFGF
jgi:hypothetical protein